MANSNRLGMRSHHLCPAVLEAYLDGELTVAEVVDADNHLANCSRCASLLRWERSFRGSIKHACRQVGEPPKRLSRKILRAIQFEDKPGGSYAGCSTSTPLPAKRHIEKSRATRDRSPKSWVSTRLDARGANPTRLRWVTLAALTVVLAPLSQELWSNHPERPVDIRTGDMHLSQLDSYLDSIVNWHKRWDNQPPNPLSRSLLRNTTQLRPLGFAPLLSLHGRREMTLGAARTLPPAVLGVSDSYGFQGHRVTFIAYSAHAMPLRARLRGTLVDRKVIYVTTRGGLAIAAVENGSIGYALLSDLDASHNAQLMNATLAMSPTNLQGWERSLGPQEFTARIGRDTSQAAASPKYRGMALLAAQ